MIILTKRTIRLLLIIPESKKTERVAVLTWLTIIHSDHSICQDDDKCCSMQTAKNQILGMGLVDRVISTNQTAKI